MTQNVFGHIDGKNLVLRYQAMLDKGLTPKKGCYTHTRFFSVAPRRTLLKGIFIAHMIRFPSTKHFWG